VVFVFDTYDLTPFWHYSPPKSFPKLLDSRGLLGDNHGLLLFWPVCRIGNQPKTVMLKKSLPLGSFIW